ncbi:flagellar hook-length control protein FliK [Roseibium sp.]|uniref:flagellar hook-length control protein FliK n=1 Tax=Roseibium sp. TaxID=1936156 RepID=UPI003B51CD9F
MVETVSAQPLPATAQSGTVAQDLEPGTELRAKVDANLPGGVVRLTSEAKTVELRVPAPLPVGSDVTITVSGTKQQPSIVLTPQTGAGNAPAAGQPPAQQVPSSGTPPPVAQPSAPASSPQPAPPATGLPQPAPVVTQFLQATGVLPQTGQTGIPAQTPAPLMPSPSTPLHQVLPPNAAPVPGGAANAGLGQPATGQAGTNPLSTQGTIPVSNPSPAAGTGITSTGATPTTSFQSGQGGVTTTSGNPVVLGQPPAGALQAGQGAPLGAGTPIGGGPTGGTTSVLGNTSLGVPVAGASGASLTTGTQSAAAPLPASTGASAASFAAQPNNPAAAQTVVQSGAQTVAQPSAGNGPVLPGGPSGLPSAATIPVGGERGANIPPTATGPVAPGPSASVQAGGPPPPVNLAQPTPGGASPTGAVPASGAQQLPGGQAPQASPLPVNPAGTGGQAAISGSGQPPVPAAPPAAPTGPAGPAPGLSAGLASQVMTPQSGFSATSPSGASAVQLPAQAYSAAKTAMPAGPAVGGVASTAGSVGTTPATPVQQAANVLRQPLSEQQASLGALFAQIGSLMSAQSAGKVSMPDAVQKAMQQILGLRLNSSQPVTGTSLQQAVRQSGQFKEGQVPLQTGGQQTPLPDLKNALLSFKSLLQQLGAEPAVRFPARQPAPPSRHGSPQGQAPQTSSGYWAGSAPQNLQSLLQETDAALARMRLAQLVNGGLAGDDGPQAATGKPMDAVVELPIAFGQETAVMQMQIGRDGGGQNGEEAGEPAWRLRFALDLTATGPLEAAVSLRGGGTFVSLWVDRKETLDLLTGQQETMEAAFADAGLDLQELRFIRGLPPKTAAKYGALINRQS